MRLFTLLLAPTLASTASAGLTLLHPPSRGTYVPNRNITDLDILENPCGPYPISKHRTPFSLKGGSPISFTTSFPISTVSVGIGLMAPRGDIIKKWTAGVPYFFVYGEGEFCWDPLWGYATTESWKEMMKRESKNGTMATILVTVGERDAYSGQGDLSLYKYYDRIEYACADVVFVDEEPDLDAGVECRNGTGVTASNPVTLAFGWDWQSEEPMDNRQKVEAEWQKQYNSTGEYGKKTESGDADEDKSGGEVKEKSDGEDSGASMFAVSTGLAALSSLFITWVAS
ncbi:hypothetical protein BJ508DRAFT_364817 [Ascobolus immersus RN42]|uniref:Copper acquisition factor BIM1-like domain-containing protein n=1 Tax=Ascobolus immersus RN42 TaxID=1160509 RepID=A0A3N4HSP0_ASCIM|nr:hypothetical protein BJ508DRAFT_364817 [Ascobolus immersus RN42]